VRIALRIVAVLIFAAVAAWIGLTIFGASVWHGSIWVVALPVVIGGWICFFAYLLLWRPLPKSSARKTPQT